MGFWEDLLEGEGFQSPDGDLEELQGFHSRFSFLQT